MGNFAKNYRFPGSGAITVPSGATADRPAAPSNGQIRYNTDTSRFEIYYNAWKSVAILGNVIITKDTFTGDGAQQDFTLSITPPSQNAPVVYLGNVHQNPGTAYTISSATLHFNSAPPNGQTIEVYHGFNSTDAN
jgi:hypothetical protein